MPHRAYKAYKTYMNHSCQCVQRGGLTLVGPPHLSLEAIYV